MYECEICGEKFKSAQGLSGHKRLSHAEIAKPNQPDEHLLSATLVSTLDSLGEHRELIANLQANMAAIDTRLDGFKSSLVRPPDQPSVALIKHWQECPDCSPVYADRRFALVGLMVADLSDSERESLWQGLRDESLAAAQALAEHSEDETPERSDQVEAVQPQRWLIVRPGYAGGFKWMDRGDSLPGLTAGNSKVEGYIKVSEDEAEVEKFRGKPGVRVIELEAEVEESVS